MPLLSSPPCQNLPFFFCIISVTPRLQSPESQSLHFPPVNGNQALIPFNAMVLWEFTKAFDNSCKTASPAPNRLIFLFFFHSLLAGVWQTNAPHWRLGVCLHHEHFSARVFLPVLLMPSGCGTELLPTQPLFPWFNLHCLSQLFNISLRNCPHKMSALVKQYIRVAPYVNPTWQDMDHSISVSEGKKSYSSFGFYWNLTNLFSGMECLKFCKKVLVLVLVLVLVEPLNLSTALSSRSCFPSLSVIIGLWKAPLRACLSQIQASGCIKPSQLY